MDARGVEPSKGSMARLGPTSWTVGSVRLVLGVATSVDGTDYTTFAEHDPDPDDYPGAEPEELATLAAVFHFGFEARVASSGSDRKLLPR